MKQNITLALDSDLLVSAKQLAAARNSSLSRMLADELTAQVGAAREYEQARQQALSLLRQGFHLGGTGITNRDDLHDRAALR